MELRDITAVVSLADCGGFHKAAERLGVDTSTLSRRIQRIENELGVLIFERSRVGIVPTSGGRELLRLARRIVEDVADLRRSAGRAGRAQIGRLRLATQLSVLGPNLRFALQSFRQSHPRVDLELTQADDSEIITGLRDYRFDAASLFTPTVTERVAAHELWAERLALAVADQHPLADRSAVMWEDVRQEPLIVQGWSSSDSYCRLESSLVGYGADFRSHRAGCGELMGLVAIGEGVMIVLASHRELRFPGVRIVDINEPDAIIGISLAWSPVLEEPIAGSFVAFMRDLRLSEADVIP